MYRFVCAVGLSTFAASLANAGIVSGVSGDLAASVEFSVSGTNLLVSLTNTSSMDITEPAQVLTAVFFRVSGDAVTLTRTSATIAPGSLVTNGTTPSDGVVGGEWAYRGGNLLGNWNQGISSSGLGIFGPGNLFPGANLAGPEGPDGVQFGIASAGDNPSTHNGGTNTPLIQNSVNFVLAGLPDNFNINRIVAVRFQYGTDLSEPNIEVLVPAPGALALAGIGVLAIGRRRR